MKRISLLFLLLAMLVYISCKKKSTPASTTPSATSTPSSLPFSIMETNYTYLDNGSTILVDSGAIAVFMQNPWGINPTVFVSAGTVSLNNTNLDFSNDQYIDTNAINISQPLKWSATGSGTITPFTYTFVPSYPKYTGGNILPDTCTKASGITFTISGVSNTTGAAWVSVSQFSSGFSKQVSSNGTVSFSTFELSTLNTNANFDIEVRLQNTFSQTLGGILHSFNNGVFYNKIAYLK